MRIVLESVLRNCDGQKVTPEHVRRSPTGTRTPSAPTRSRSWWRAWCCRTSPACRCWPTWPPCAAPPQRLGKPAARIEPLVPVDLVVDHSVMVDYYGTKDALDLNMKLEFQRNRERYEFMKWGMQAFDTFGVVPPGFGIVHQVNLEYLARGVHKTADGVYYPDSLVGTDSHTTMINGIGVVGWGVGGIEAEAAMLGQPVYMLTPDVVGFELTGKLREGCTATDLVLTVTELLRKHKVVGKFVEFFGEGTRTLAVPDRATIGNMAPEYGATMGFFPVDEKTIDYFRGTGRSKEEIDALEATSARRACSASPARRDRLLAGGEAGPRRGDAQPVGPQAAAGPHRDRQGVARAVPSLFSKPIGRERLQHAGRDAATPPPAARGRRDARSQGAGQPAVKPAAPRLRDGDGIQQADAGLGAVRSRRGVDRPRST
jgi:aconitate hydratase